jgi:hypothetical protein
MGDAGTQITTSAAPVIAISGSVIAPSELPRWSLLKSEQVIQACDHSERCAIVTHEESYPQADGL